MRRSCQGFTLIELLIVIAIIAILSTIGAVVYTGMQNKTRITATTATIEAVYKQIEQKRIANQTTLLNITGSGCSDCSCRNGSNGFDKDSVSTPTCLNRLTLTFVTNLGMSSIPRDGWGDPILVDENELEGGTCGSRDLVRSINGQSMQVPFYKCP